MPTLAIDIPQQTLEHLAMEPGVFVVTMKAMTALKLYELGQLSSQDAATLAGISRGEFLQLLRTYQVPPFERLDDTGTAIRPVHELTNAAVLRLATMQMPPWQSRRLHELLDHQREGTISVAEAQELAQLLQLNDRALLLKAEAMTEAVCRGLWAACTGA
jgi:predicted HTH domain antitoxin